MTGTVLDPVVQAAATDPSGSVAAAIEAADVTKAYGGILALDRVSFRAEPGKVTVLLGENGAGKSTLMRVLAGETVPDSGHLLREGRQMRLRSSRDARREGIALIHQELSLFPALTVAQNIFAGMEKHRFGVTNERRHGEIAADILSRLDGRISPYRPVGELAVGQRQLVEIAKALAHDARVVIMDEPTSALSNAEVEALFNIIRELTARGVAIIYISHRMDEIFRIADQLVVMRDGRKVAEAPSGAVNMNWINENMLGSRQRAAMQELVTSRRTSAGGRDEILQVRNVSLADPDTQRLLLSDAAFSLRQGEILGVYGLLGAGKTELAETVAGLRSDATGEILLAGRPLAPTPAARIAGGIAFVPEDRRHQAIIPTASVRDNITLSCLRKMATFGVVSSRRERARVTGMVEDLSIRLASAGQSIMGLSGGNQQKAIVARALLTEPRVLVLDEPTRGIDVGAKAEMFRLMRKLADRGLAILFASSELPEIMAVADRVLVLSRGRVRGIFEGAELTERNILDASADEL
jgi:ABC-type sugar transport system ATPase subunit